jgi:hypothetical protein
MCFQAQMDSEIEERALRKFVLGGPLYFAYATGHLLSFKGSGISLCRQKRFQRASVNVIYSAAIKPPAHLPQICAACEAKARAFIEGRVA